MRQINILILFILISACSSAQGVVDGYVQSSMDFIMQSNQSHTLTHGQLQAMEFEDLVALLERSLWVSVAIANYNAGTHTEEQILDFIEDINEVGAHEPILITEVIPNYSVASAASSVPEYGVPLPMWPMAVLPLLLIGVRHVGSK